VGAIPGAKWTLEEANAFVMSLDAERTWFRYHHLFADLLRLELRRTLPERVPMLHLQAAEWLAEHGHVTEAIRHRQAAGDWPGAARLLADHCFSITLDGQAQTIQALLQAFPPGADHPELALVHAMAGHILGRLDEAAAYLAVAEKHAETTPPDRRHRLRVAIAALKLSLARRRGDKTGVVDQVSFLSAPLTGKSDEDIALGSDLRAVALLNLGVAEAWSPGGLADAERHLREGAALAWEIGRPYVEVSCLAQLGFASKIHSFATTQTRCREAIALAERFGWGSEWVAAPALITLARTLICRPTPDRTSGCCCITPPRCFMPAAVIIGRRLRNGARPSACSRNWRPRTRSRTRSRAGCWPPRPASESRVRPARP
jgi:LuxR family maltose regulon positive regulatory protein